jgi:hypothetical protein
VQRVSEKMKNPGKTGVSSCFLLYEAAALTAELRRPSHPILEGHHDSFKVDGGPTVRRNESGFFAKLLLALAGNRGRITNQFAHFDPFPSGIIGGDNAAEDSQSKGFMGCFAASFSTPDVSAN